MDDGLVHRRACRAEIREFRFRALALEYVLRRNRFRRALIGDGAFDDRPIDTPRADFRWRFAFRGRRRRDILEAAIDHRFEGIKLRRRLVAPSVASAAITTAAFAEGLAPLAAPRSPIPIAAFAIARLTFAALAPAFAIAALILALGAIAPLTVAIAVTSIAPTLIRMAAPTRAAFAMPRLCALARSSSRAFAGWCCRSFGPRPAAPPAPAARAIAWR